MAATDGAPQQVIARSTCPALPASRQQWRREFPGDERQLGLLRRWLASLLPECPARDDVVLVATELASNAVRHTASGQGGSFAVDITWDRVVVRVAVADYGAPDDPRVIDDPAAEQGRGLLLVRGLSLRTGVVGDQRGRLVWAEISWGDAATPASASPQAGYEAVICEGEAALARRFAGVPAWFGRSTLAWWAVAGSYGLVSAPTARELAGLLYRLLDAGGQAQVLATGRTPHAARGRPSAKPGQRLGRGGRDGTSRRRVAGGGGDCAHRGAGPGRVSGLVPAGAWSAAGA